MEIEHFLREYKGIRSPRTLSSYRGSLAHFDLFLAENSLAVEAVHPSDIRRLPVGSRGASTTKQVRPACPTSRSSPISRP